MRVDKNTGHVYKGIADWLLTDGHFIWIISLFFAILAYYVTTEEI